MIVKPVSVPDFREAARRRLPHFLFEYIDGGSYAEVTLAANVSDLRSIALRQRVLKDVSQIDLSARMAGQMWKLPIALAPVGLAGMAARRGEVQALQAAEQCGVPFCLSTMSVCDLDEVAEAATQPFWFQLYMVRDRGFMRDLLAKARSRKCGALVFTVDLPVPGARYRDVRSGLAAAPGPMGALRRAVQAAMKPEWAWDVALQGQPLHLGNIAPVLEGQTGLEDFFGWMRRNFDASVTWKDIDFVRAEWPGPLIIKGVLDPADAQEAVAQGVNTIVVSNHGGRQLDGAVSTAKALPRIADAVGGQIEIMADGGVRSGLDVVRMLALGASGVMIGRPWVFALGAEGQEGVRRMLRLVEAEMRIAMALTGHMRLQDVTRDALVMG